MGDGRFLIRCKLEDLGLVGDVRANPKLDLRLIGDVGANLKVNPDLGLTGDVGVMSDPSTNLNPNPHSN